MVLDSGDPWKLEGFQAEIADDVFSDVPEVWVVIPEGNAKTTLMSGLALYGADYREHASIPLAAASRDQAGLLFSQAAGFVYRSPGLEERFRVFEGYRRIDAKRTGSRIQVYAADDRTGDGVLIDQAFVDEVHRHRDMRLVRTWRGKLDKRGGQIVLISTAGEPGSEFELTRERLRLAGEQVRKDAHLRVATDDVVLHEFALQREQDLDDMKLVKSANPLSTITPGKLARRRRSPSMTAAHWMRFVCNIAVRETGAWLDDATGWHQHTDPFQPDHDFPIFIGADPARTFDTFSIVAFQPLGDREGAAWPLAIFKPGEQDGGAIPLWKVRQALEEALAEWRVSGIAYDRGSGLDLLVEEMERETTAPFVAVPMDSATWAPLTADLRSAIHRGAISHPADDEFTSHVLNGETKDSEHGPRLHGRTKSKVDALIALGMAWRLAFHEPPDDGVSIYQTRGLL